MNPPSPVYDPSPNNPFVAQPTTWDTDDVADTRTMAYLRRKVERVRFLINHPANDYPWDQIQMDNMIRDLNRWLLLLNKAHYN